MSKSSRENEWSRRAMLGSVAMAAAGAWGARPGGATAAELVAGGTPRNTVRDRLWIFSVLAGGDDKSLERGNVLGGSRMTPAEGAFWLNVPNLLLIRSSDEPPLPAVKARAPRRPSSNTPSPSSRWTASSGRSWAAAARAA